MAERKRLFIEKFYGPDETSRGCGCSGAGLNVPSSYPCSPLLLAVDGAADAAPAPHAEAADGVADEVPAPHAEAADDMSADEVPASHDEAADDASADEVVGRRAVEQGESFVRDAVSRCFLHGARAARWLWWPDALPQSARG